MENIVKERIRELLLNKNSNPTQLAKEHSVNQKTLNNQINSDVQLSISTILLILKSFPDLSAEWLLRGEGEMLRGNDNALDNDTLKKEIVLYVDENGFLKIKK